MYLRYYNLKERPFMLSPGTDFLFKSNTYLHTLEELEEGIKTRQSLMLVIGESGTGKTTLCQSLFKDLMKRKNIEIAVIFNAFFSSLEMLYHINKAFLLPAAGKTSEELIRELNDFLLRCKKTDKTVILVIDECQNLTLELIEQIRMLSDLETEKEKLLTIVLLGQPEFYHQLKEPYLRSLDQRITIRSHLKSLDKNEIYDYIYYRLKTAGDTKQAIQFTPQAIKLIAAFSQCNPRVINAVCENALMLGAMYKSSTIDKQLAKKAISRTKGFSPSGSKTFRQSNMFHSSSLFILLIIVVFAVIKIAFLKKPVNPEDKKKPSDIFSLIVHYDTLDQKTTAPASPLENVTSLSPEEYTVSQVVYSSLEVLKLWNYKRALLEELWHLYQNRQEITFDIISQNTGFTIIKIHTTSRMLKTLNMPLILELFEEGNIINYGTVIGFNENGIVLKKLAEKIKTYSPQELNKIWLGNAIVFCKNMLLSDKIIFKGATVNKEEIKYLQIMLLKAGFIKNEDYDEQRIIFDTVIEKAVKAFQKQYGFPQDGILSKEGKILLYRIVYGQEIPVLAK